MVKKATELLLALAVKLFHNLKGGCLFEADNALAHFVLGPDNLGVKQIVRIIAHPFGKDPAGHLAQQVAAGDE